MNQYYYIIINQRPYILKIPLVLTFWLSFYLDEFALKGFDVLSPFSS